MAKENEAVKKAQRQLHKLQMAAASVIEDYRRSHNNLYSHLSELYLWWRFSNKISGYLDREYAALNIKGRTLSEGINFRPLLLLAWGRDSGLPTALYSRVINALHQEHEKKPELYQKDGAAKLANFIKQSGGATKLAAYGSDENDDDDDDGQTAIKSFSGSDDKELEEKARKKLLNDAQAFILGKPMPALHVNSPPSIADQGFALLLVKKTATGLELVGSRADTTLIEDMLIDSYRRKFEAQPTAIRSLLELLQTQCLPTHLMGIAYDLRKKPVYKELWSKRLRASAQRVIFRHEHDDIILSPVDAESGVVSCIKPSKNELGEIVSPIISVLTSSDRDAFLGPVSRRKLERECLSSFDFNLYKPKKTTFISHYCESGDASHILRLEHTTNGKKRIFLPVFPFYDSMKDYVGQLVPEPSYRFKPLWESNIDPSWFQRLSDEFVTPWMNSHAKHLKRDPHAMLNMTFDDEQLRIEFVYRDGKFENNISVPLDQVSIKHSTVSVKFASIDIIPALYSLSLLPIIGSATLSLDMDVMRLQFETADNSSTYEIWVPTINTNNERNSAPFSFYTPQTTQDMSGVGGDEEDSYVDVVEDWPEAFGIGA